MIVRSRLQNLKKVSPFVVFLAGLVIILFGVMVIYQISPKHPKIDWLSQQDWSHMAGAKYINNGVNFTPVGREINHKDTSKAQPNPPVNVRGSHLKVTGDFRVEMDITGVENNPEIQLYGQVPIIYDEWRQERESVKIEATSGEVRIRIWDGTSSTSIDERIFKTSKKNKTKIVLTQKNNKIWVQVNNDLLGSIPNHNIFAKGDIWFGANAKTDTNGWSLKTLTVQSLGKSSLVVAKAPDIVKISPQADSLRTLASVNPRNIPIGAAVSVYPLFTDNQYAKIVFSQFSMLTPENSLKPQTVQPLKDVYVFDDADNIVEAAQKNQMLVHGHALVLGKANPEWMQKTPISERKQIMVDHITGVVSHFKGRIAQWDVVNEPLSEDDIDYSAEQQGIRKQMWSDAMGESYIDTAFIAARAADPSAKLYLNEFGLEKDGQRWDAMVNLVTRLKARGVPIDGVGFEAHVYHSPADTIDPAVLQRHIQILAGLGLVSRISEIDVLGDDLTFQSSQYGDILKVCLIEPTCTSYGVWGITDLYGSTTLSDRYPVKLGDSLIWNSDYVAKPVLTSLQNILKQ